MTILSVDQNWKNFNQKCKQKESVDEFKTCFNQTMNSILFLRKVNIKSYHRYLHFNAHTVAEMILPGDGTVETKKDYKNATFKLDPKYSYIIHLFDKDFLVYLNNPLIVQRSFVTIHPYTSMGYIGIKAIQHERLNTEIDPCEPSREYVFQNCINKKMIVKLGCQPFWLDHIQTDFQKCSEVSKLFEFIYDMGKLNQISTEKELVEKYSCSKPCTYMEYKVRIRNALTEIDKIHFFKRLWRNLIHGHLREVK